MKNVKKHLSLYEMCVYPLFLPLLLLTKITASTWLCAGGIVTARTEPYYSVSPCIPWVTFIILLRCQFSQFMSSYQPHIQCSILLDSLLIENICFVSEGMVWFIRKLCDLGLSRYEFQENGLVLCRNDRKKFKFVQKNFICTINQLPFPFKIFQQQRGLFYSRINITHACTHTHTIIFKN